MADKPSKVVGIDFGERRIGLAISDSNKKVAVAHKVIVKSGDDKDDLDQLIDEIVLINPSKLIVGLPISLDGSINQAAKKVLSFCEIIKDRLAIEIELWDERLTSKIAQNLVSTQSNKKRKSSLDAVAAAIILQSWLESYNRKPGNSVESN